MMSPLLLSYSLSRNLTLRNSDNIYLYMPKEKIISITNYKSQNGIRVRPDILVSIYGRVLGSNPRFQKPEKLSEGEMTC